MDAIEPNWFSLLWYALFATICGIGILVFAGMLPLDGRKDGSSSNLTIGLGICNALLLGLLLLGTGLYGYIELRWSTLIVVTGLIILFAPGLFEEWRWPLGSARIQMLVLFGAQLLALAALHKIGGSALAIIS